MNKHGILNLTVIREPTEQYYLPLWSLTAPCGDCCRIFSGEIEGEVEHIELAVKKKKWLCADCKQSNA